VTQQAKNKNETAKAAKPEKVLILSPRGHQTPLVRQQPVTTKHNPPQKHNKSKGNT
jgi:hypothetical protein